jgi:hypothetical protein
MANYQSDEALQELHDEMYSSEAARPKGGFAAMDQKTKFWVGLFFGALILMIMLEKISMQEGLIVGGVGILILYMIKGTNPQRKELTWLECQIRLYDLLEFLQKHPIGNYPQIPPGEIRITPVGRKQWYEGQGFKRSFGIKIYNEERDIEDIYFVELDIFNGDIITFREAPEGVRGDETKDIKLMPTYSDLIAKKRENYMGRGSKYL